MHIFLFRLNNKIRSLFNQISEMFKSSFSKILINFSLIVICYVFINPSNYPTASLRSLQSFASEVKASE